MNSVIITRTSRTVRTAGGVVGVPPIPRCPACGASWAAAGTVLPGAMPCSCTSKYGRHDAWRCRTCSAIVAEECTDTDRWDSVHASTSVVRYTAVR